MVASIGFKSLGYGSGIQSALISGRYRFSFSKAALILFCGSFAAAVEPHFGINTAVPSSYKFCILSCSVVTNVMNSQNNEIMKHVNNKIGFNDLF